MSEVKEPEAKVQLTDEERAALAEMFEKQTAKPANAPEPINLRDKQDFIDMAVSMTVKKWEELNKNRDLRNLAPQPGDNVFDKNQKFRQLVRSIFKGDDASYEEAYKSFNSKNLTREFSTTDSAGGYSIPPDVRTEIMQAILDAGVVRGNANIIPTTSDSIQLNGLLTSVAAAWTTEATALSGTSGTQEAPTIDIGDIAAILGPFSSQILADAAPGFYNSWIQNIGSSIAQLEDYTGFLGDGTATYNSITGLFKSTSDGLTTVTLDTSSVDVTVAFVKKMRDCISALPSAKRVGAKWFIHRSLEGALMNLSGTDGHFVFMQQATQASMGNILGYPYELVEALPDVTTVSSDTVFAGFGNMKNALHVGDRENMTMFVGREGTVDGKSMFAANQLAVRVTERLGMKVYVPRHTKFGGSNNVERLGFAVMKTKA